MDTPTRTAEVDATSRSADIVSSGRARRPPLPGIYVDGVYAAAFAGSLSVRAVVATLGALRRVDRDSDAVSVAPEFR